jgi:hypothetical protein
MERKRIRLTKGKSAVDEALQALSDGEDGAEYDILFTLCRLVLGEQDIDPDLQKVANVILVQAISHGRLPSKRKGRPKQDKTEDGISIATMYYGLLDSGIRYGEAVAKVASTFHKDERHIMRLVKEHKHWVGDTKAQRESRREWHRVCAYMEERRIAEGGESTTSYLDWALQIIRDKDRNPLETLNGIVQEVLDRRTELT